MHKFSPNIKKKYQNLVLVSKNINIFLKTNEQESFLFDNIYIYRSIFYLLV